MSSSKDTKTGPGRKPASNEAASLTTTQKLELHNRQVVLSKAKEKLQAGKALSKREILVVEEEEQKATESELLAKISDYPKKRFVDQTDGSYKVYLNWQEEYGMPFSPGGDTVDLFAVLKWFRTFVAAGLRSKEGDATEHQRRLTKAKAEREELRLAKERGELLLKEEVDTDNAMMWTKIREGIEMLDPAGQEIMLEKIEELEAIWDLGDDSEPTEQV